MDSPESLAARAAAGDREAFSDLMRRTKASLYRVIRRYVGDEHEAFDLLQETYAAAWLNIERYDPARPFEAWIRTIALNKCRDWSRRRAVRRLIRGGVPLEAPEARAVADGADPADVALDLADDLARLRLQLDRLPPHLKAPLLLTAIEGRNHAEAASILGLSVKAVETRVARARRKLFDALQSNPGPGRSANLWTRGKAV